MPFRSSSRSASCPAWCRFALSASSPSATSFASCSLSFPRTPITPLKGSSFGGAPAASLPRLELLPSLSTAMVLFEPPVSLASTPSFCLPTRLERARPPRRRSVSFTTPDTSEPTNGEIAITSPVSKSSSPVPCCSSLLLVLSFCLTMLPRSRFTMSSWEYAGLSWGSCGSSTSKSRRCARVSRTAASDTATLARIRITTVYRV
mmetsp:Transcript_5496/g.10516  ORF Transcript_5496/g.10516 Transcript_5496/m.10516 type:complete len:204 (+) Transcript_5496:1536-2147(+)